LWWIITWAEDRPCLSNPIMSAFIPFDNYKPKTCSKNIFPMEYLTLLVFMFYIQVYQLTKALVQIWLLCNESSLTTMFNGHTIHCRLNTNLLLCLMAGFR
jgi:hypothetical protein